MTVSMFLKGNLSIFLSHPNRKTTFISVINKRVQKTVLFFFCVRARYDICPLHHYSRWCHTDICAISTRGPCSPGIVIPPPICHLACLTLWTSISVSIQTPGPPNQPLHPVSRKLSPFQLIFHVAQVKTNKQKNPELTQCLQTRTQRYRVRVQNTQP
jgi:hypothetical protein